MMIADRLRPIRQMTRNMTKWSSVRLSKSDASLLKRILDITSMKPSYFGVPIAVFLAELREVRDMDMSRAA